MPAAHGLNKQHNDNNIIYFSLNYKKNTLTNGNPLLFERKTAPCTVVQNRKWKELMMCKRGLSYIFYYFPALFLFFSWSLGLSSLIKYAGIDTAAQGKEVYGWEHFFETTVIIGNFFLLLTFFRETCFLQ